MKIGDVLEFEINYMTSRGEGVCFLPDKKMVLINGVNEQDEAVKARIVGIGFFIIRADKINRVRTQEPKEELVINNNPYEVDGEEDDEEDDEEDS